jgi:ribosomal protein S18 acetylase RimI-like enzyme
MVFNFVVASNTRAVALWRRYGFEQVGCVPGAFRNSAGEDADALVMFRPL